MSNKKIIHAISAVLAIGVTSTIDAETITTANNQSGMKMMQAPDVKGMEKCFGIVKSGLNDCGNASHTCSGGAKADNDADEWVFVPTGLCRRIVGGSLKPSNKS